MIMRRLLVQRSLAIATGLVIVAITVPLLAAGCGRVGPKSTPTASLPPGKTGPGASISARVITSIHMVDAESGWVLTDTAVFRTTDGGAHWADVTPDVESGARPGPGAFLDANTAWVIFSKDGDNPAIIFSTTDGGKTWHSGQVPSSDPHVSPYVTALQFIDPHHGWLLASYGAAAGSEAVELYQSTDGGISWTLAASGMPTNPSGSLPFGGHKTGLGFRDLQHGWIPGGDAGSAIVLLATQDGGRTWRRQAVRAPAGYHTEGGAVETQAPVFFGSKDGFLPVVFHQQGQPVIFYATHDGGASWQATAAVSSANNNALLWSFADARHGFATDGDRLYATVDGARTWKTVPTNIPLDGVTGLDFVSPAKGFAVVDGNVVSTDDGGRTWATMTDEFVLHSLPDNFQPTAIAFWDAEHGILAGTAGFASRYLGIVAVTGDGGQSWQVVRQGGAGFLDVAAAGTGTAWAVKSSMCAYEADPDCTLDVLRTDDGGNTWQDLHQKLASVSFAGRDQGWGLPPQPAGPGGGRVIFTTQDGGHHWGTIRSPCSGATGQVVAISLASGSNAYVACAGEPGAGQQMKSVFRTRDGGKTWTALADPGGGGYVAGLFFLPDGHGWVWMRRGPLVATMDGGATWSPVGVVQPEVVEAYSVFFLSDQTGFALVRDNNERTWRLVKTTDGGQNWVTVHSWPIQ